MTITEFLLARIPEDEAASVHWTCDCDLEGLPLEHGWSCQERVRAECEAKRRIVALFGAECGEYERDRDHYPGTRCTYPCEGCEAARAADDSIGVVSALLAQPYAAHPDFDPAWSVTAAT